MYILSLKPLQSLNIYYVIKVEIKESLKSELVQRDGLWTKIKK